MQCLFGEIISGHSISKILSKVRLGSHVGDSMANTSIIYNTEEHSAGSLIILGSISMTHDSISYAIYRQ